MKAKQKKAHAARVRRQQVVQYRSERDRKQRLEDLKLERDLDALMKDVPLTASASW